MTERSWDSDILKDLFNERERERRLIEESPLGHVVEDESWYWHLENKGTYTVKCNYVFLQGSRYNLGLNTTTG